MTTAAAALTDLRLSDDEVVALAADLDTAWQAPLPTVDTENPDAVLRAILRGQRSLALRGLLHADGELAAGAEELRTALCTGRDRVTVYLAGADLTRASWGLSMDLVRTGSQWLVEYTSPIGVHGFEVRDTPGVVSLIESTITDALAATDLWSQDDLRLLVAGITSTGTRMLAVNPTGARGGVLGVDGAATSDVEIDGASWPGELAAILATCGAGDSGSQ